MVSVIRKPVTVNQLYHAFISETAFCLFCDGLSLTVILYEAYKGTTVDKSEWCLRVNTCLNSNCIHYIEKAQGIGRKDAPDACLYADGVLRIIFLTFSVCDSCCQSAISAEDSHQHTSCSSRTSDENQLSLSSHCQLCDNLRLWLCKVFYPENHSECHRAFLLKIFPPHSPCMLYSEPCDLTSTKRIIIVIGLGSVYLDGISMASTWSLSFPYYLNEIYAFWANSLVGILFSPLLGLMSSLILYCRNKNGKNKSRNICVHTKPLNPT